MYIRVAIRALNPPLEVISIDNLGLILGNRCQEMEILKTFHVMGDSAILEQRQCGSRKMALPISNFPFHSP